MSLLEILIAATLGVVLLGIVFSLLRPTMQITRRGSVQVEMQQQAHVLVARLSEDIAHSMPNGVSLSIGPPLHLGIVRINDLSAALRMKQWERYALVYAWDPTRGLVTRTRSNDLAELDGTRPVRLSAAQMQAIAADPLLPRQALASGVTALSVGSPATPPITLDISLERSDATGRDRPERFRLTAVAPMRNQSP